MSKRFIIGLLVFLSANVVTHAQTKKSNNKPAKPATKTITANKDSLHNIQITITPYKNEKVYLGCYYGKNKVLVDSTVVDENSKGTFKGSKLTGGIYFVVSPRYSILFELLVGENQNFSIQADTTKPQDVKIVGSLDNDIFKGYTKISMEKGALLSQQEQAYKNAKTKADSNAARDKVIEINEELQRYRDSIIKTYPDAMLSFLLAAMKRPEAPKELPKDPVTGKLDSLYPYRFIKDNYWNDVDFFDDRLLRTPFFEPKLDDYFKNYVYADPDSTYKEVNWMLLSARTGKEMYPYLLTKFTNKYMSPEYMGQDKVFIKIYEDFFAKGDTTFLNKESRKTVTEKYYTLIANQIGNPAPLLDITDMNGKTQSLYSLSAKYTIVAFWDPTCGHCKEEIPRLDSIYKNKWKALGVKVYNVDVKDNTQEEYKKFIQEKKLSSDWVFTYQEKSIRDAEAAAGQPNFRQLYDVYKTPTLYLLDAEKRIIAKQLSINQFDDIIAAKNKRDKK